MRHAMRIGIGLFVLSLAAPAAAVELNYQWKKGDVHRFQYQDTTHFKLEMPGMAGMEGMGMGMPGMGPGGLDMTMEMDSTFAMKVLKVLKSGEAEVELTVEKIVLIQNGANLPALKQIPPDARVVRAVIDRKGRARFERMVTVYVQDDQVYLGIHKAEAGPGRAATSVSAGGPEGGLDVDLVAAIDPKTGKIHASAKVRERPPAVRKVKIRKQDPGVDVLPRRIFELMVLPNGGMAVGAKQEFKTPLAAMSAVLESLEGAIAVVHFTSAAQVKVDTTEPGAPAGMEDDEGAGDDDAAADDDMAPPAGLPGMGGMGGMGAGPAGPSSVDMDVKVDSRLHFDTAAGRLLGLEGSIDTRMGMGGMGGMKVEARFTLKRV